MKKTQLHIYCLLFIALLHFQNAFSITVVNIPQQTRTFDEDFKTRYAGNRYNYEGNDIVTTTPSGSGNYEEYSSQDPKLKEDDDDSDGFSIDLGPLRLVFYIAIGLAVIYLVYILLNEGGSGLFSTKQNKKLNPHDYDITAENIEDTDIVSLIKSAENNNDYRLAIRYYYLLALQNLSAKKHIKFEDDKTNADYLNEVSNKPFSLKFGYAQYLYNYIWYGKFPLSAEQYKKAKSNFETFLTLIK